MRKLFAAGRIPSRNSQKPMPIRTAKYTLPSFYTSYLFYGDATGLDEEELEEIRLFLLRNNLMEPIDVSEETWFQWYNDLNPSRKLGCDVAEFTFPVEIAP